MNFNHFRYIKILLSPFFLFILIIISAFSFSPFKNDILFNDKTASSTAGYENLNKPINSDLLVNTINLIEEDLSKNIGSKA